jgi:hypothetical protein
MLPCPAVPPEHTLTGVEFMERRRKRAKRPQLWRYAEDWWYDFLPGDGDTFDYGRDFHECATQKLYHSQGTDEFLPFYCFLDLRRAASTAWDCTGT